MINKLCLGTVQFGLKYGIKNKTGEIPTSDKVFSLLELAINLGIEYFDTASVYGSAEDILGQFLVESQQNVKIISKLKPMLLSREEADSDKVEVEVKKSLNRLHQTAIDGYLLHDAKNLYQNNIMLGLYKSKEKGLIKNIGVSIYDPEDALYAVQLPDIDYIQIPYNVLDQRLDFTNFFELANKNRVVVFARSAFLQGLLTMEVDEIPENLSDVKPYLERFHTIIAEFGYTKTEAALLFSYFHPGVDKVVFGVDSVEQLKKNMDIIRKSDHFFDCYCALKGQFADVERKIIVPSLWGGSNHEAR